jgi:hypothetical protein
MPISFLVTMALRPRLVVSVDNICEGNRDVVLEGKVLSRYKNWDPNKEYKFLYLYCNLIDKAGLTTIIVNARNPQIE